MKGYLSNSTLHNKKFTDNIIMHVSWKGKRFLICFEDFFDFPVFGEGVQADFSSFHKVYYLTTYFFGVLYIRAFR